MEGELSSCSSWRKKQVLLVALLISFLMISCHGVSAETAASAPTTITPCEFPAIFNFGDSNSDTGGLSAAFGQVGPPYGETYFHGPAGRYSDGRLIIDFIAESLRLPYLSAFLDALGSNFTHGANFATAGSTIRVQNTTRQQSGFSPISLEVQYHQFNDFHRRSQIISKQGGVFGELVPEAEDFARALYTFDIGQNDLTSGYLLNKTADEVRAYVPDVVEQLKSIVRKISDQGGRSFWIHNTGPLGCLPYSLNHLPAVTAAQVDEAGCATPYNQVAQYFNSKLKEAVIQLRNELPNAALTYVDIYSIKYDLIRNATKLGFADPLTVCCRYGCGRKTMVNGKEVLSGKSCKDPSVIINWDAIHYTEAANKWVFDKIVDGSYSDPPIPLNMACHRL